MVNVLLANLLQAWIVGVLYGVNLVLAILCLHKLAPIREQFFRITQWLFFAICILVITTTIHAALAITDLIRGFAQAEDALPYFVNAGRPMVLGILIIYAFNVNVGDAFMAWRAFVMCNRSQKLAIVYIILISANCGISVISTVAFGRAGTLSERTAHAWIMTAWAISVAIQLSGSIIIGWRIAATPIAATSGRKFDPWVIVWVAVESGAIYTFLTIGALSVSFPAEAVSYFLSYILAQVSAFAVFTITLRECWKTEQEIARERVNATSTFLINDRLYSRRSSISMTGHRHHNSSTDGLAVDVLTTTRLEHVAVRDEDIKVVPRLTAPPLSQWA
ncbi:unnamed protein product [Peniophora sp. CBMAI 1063]|nr:unnamed protein product [Peniophora sp. CBMAI 1063]